MSVRSQPSITQSSIDTPGARDNLARLVDFAAVVHGRIDALKEHCLGSVSPEIQSGKLASAPGLHTFPELLQQLDFRLRGIDEAIDYMTARM